MVHDAFTLVDLNAHVRLAQIFKSFIEVVCILIYTSSKGREMHILKTSKFTTFCHFACSPEFKDFNVVNFLREETSLITSSSGGCTTKSQGVPYPMFLV
jgi:hypothetical protein